jgi:hypothetical protein
MQGNEIELHDIKPILEIQEYSLYYFLGLVGFLILLSLAIAYLLHLWLKKRKAFNIRKEHKKLLFSLELSDAKKAAYDITFYGATFKNDTPRNLEIYNNLCSKLEEYKYKKYVNTLDEDTLGYLELYKGMCDV